MTERGDEKSAVVNDPYDRFVRDSMEKGMTYNPYLSHSFASFSPSAKEAWENPDNWEGHLFNGPFVMDDMAADVRDDQASPMDLDLCIGMEDYGVERDGRDNLDEPSDLEWLIKYMELHYNKFGSHFEWLNLEEKES
jgi:hypothetical protein